MKKKILVVDKNKEVLELVDTILSAEGYDVFTSYIEEGVFEQILSYKPDVVLLDIIQPTEWGTELCRKIKVSDKTKHIPVIVLSTYDRIESFKKICADEVVEKPFDVDFLLSAIEEQMVG